MRATDKKSTPKKSAPKKLGVSTGIKAPVRTPTKSTLASRVVKGVSKAMRQTGFDYSGKSGKGGPGWDSSPSRENPYAKKKKSSSSGTAKKK